MTERIYRCSRRQQALRELWPTTEAKAEINQLRDSIYLYIEQCPHHLAGLRELVKEGIDRIVLQLRYHESPDAVYDLRINRQLTALHLITNTTEFIGITSTGQACRCKIICLDTHFGGLMHTLQTEVGFEDAWIIGARL